MSSLVPVSARVDAVVVGAGFAGMYAVHRLGTMGLSVQCYEAGTEVGGTWYWNRYPGARCDVESLEYSYSFDEDLQQEWVWTERYAAQPEILAYASHVADRFDLRRHIAFETRVTEATWAEDAGEWLVSTDAGQHLAATFLVAAVGCLSTASVPDIEGVEHFGGQVHHTGRWPKEGVDVSGLRVGVIGTGSSAVQAIPVLAERCEHLTVFQRTAQYTIPARNRPLDPADMDAVKARYPAFRAENRTTANALSARHPPHRERAVDSTDQRRLEEFEERWDRGGTNFLAAFRDLMFDETANEYAAAFVRDKIAAIVDDPEVARRLTPQHRIGCKRLVIDSGYYETFNRPNVTLVDVSADPIEAITPTGVKTAADHVDVDVLVFATGFDAMTGSLLRMGITGVGGRSLAEVWAAGPVNYLGLMVPGFPNLFTVTGPGSPSVLANMVVAIEHHVEWIAECIDHVRAGSRSRIEATDGAAEQWVAHVNAVADRTIYPSCNSWYLGANVPGKPRVFMPLLGFPDYVSRCAAVVQDGYRGFEIG